MNLAILGHATRGKEVIEILEMLGGKNANYCYGGFINSIYFINENGYIEVCDNMHHLDYLQLTLEEFLEKFPYKVGNKVNYVKYNDICPSVYTIQRMRWTGATIEYVLDSSGFSALTKDLQSYKEEPMENTGTLVEIDLTREESKAEEIEVILGDYEFVLKDGKTYFVKKKPEYPKTYEECCEVLVGRKPNPHEISFDKMELCLVDLDNSQNIDFQTPQLLRLNGLFKLLMCRNAYWKIAGDWKYDVNKTEEYFYIVNKCGRIVKEHYMNFNHILAFPTAEMRDAFKENFDDDIEFCKEFL